MLIVYFKIIDSRDSRLWRVSTIAPGVAFFVCNCLGDGRVDENGRLEPAIGFVGDVMVDGIDGVHDFYAILR